MQLKNQSNVRKVSSFNVFCLEIIFLTMLFLIPVYADQCLTLSGPAYVQVDDNASYSASGSVDGGYNYTSTSSLLSIDPNTGDVWAMDDPSSSEGDEELDVSDSDGNTGSLNITIFDITHETVAVTPSNSERTLLGLYEEVNLGVVPELHLVVPTWSLTGNGTLTPAPSGIGTTVNGETIEYKAPFAASSSEEIDITVGDGTASVIFSVIAPSGVAFTSNHETMREKDPLSLEVKANIYVQPDSVSFYNVYFYEGTCPITTSGYFHSGPGAITDDHPASAYAVQGTTVVDGEGTTVGTLDTVQALTAGPSYQPGGTWTWSIPQYYTDSQYAPTGIWICNVDHTVTLSGVSVDGNNATLRLQKDQVDDSVSNP